VGRREGPIEDYLVEQIELHGGMSEKHVSPGQNGVPDQLVTWNGLMDLVEAKAPLGERSGAQIRDHARRLKLGVIVFTTHTKAEVDGYIEMRRPFWPR
jgi:hypothetical protein